MKNTDNLQSSHCGADLLRVPDRHDVGLKHLRDEDEPIGELGGRLVEVGRRHCVWHTRRLEAGLLAREAGHVHSRGHRTHWRQEGGGRRKENQVRGERLGKTNDQNQRPSGNEASR